MDRNELLAKVERDEELTLEEICEYEKIYQPIKHTYGKYGTLAKIYLEQHNQGKRMLIDNIPEYLHNVDKQASDLYDVMFENLSKQERYKRTGNFLHDARVLTEMKSIIEEEILSTIVYV